MKTFVLSALLAVATLGNTFASHTPNPRPGRGAGNELTEKTGPVEAFKSQIAFHQRNVQMLWEQYELAIARIRNSRGNQASLEQDKAFFVGVYQQDIQKGIRVEESRKAIAEIETRYARACDERTAYEAKKIAAVQAQLRAELEKEAKKFNKVKRANTKLVNAETLPLLEETERYLAQSIERAAHLASANDGDTVAAR